MANSPILNRLVLMLALISSSGMAQSKFTAEEKFQDLFVTAGYSTAFGAALGAAALGLEQNPGSKLRYLAVGASLGFIFGSVLGTYLIVNPGFGNGARAEATPFPDKPSVMLGSSLRF